MKFFEDAGNGCARVGIEAAFVFCLCKKIVNNGCIDIINRCVRANLPIPRWLVDGEDHPLDFIGRHYPVLGSCPHVRNTIKIVWFADSLRDHDNDQVLSLFFDDTDIRCDLWFYPGGNLLGEFAKRVVGGIYADYCPGIGPAKRDDAAMIVEEPADGFERRLDEGEGFLKIPECRIRGGS